MSVEEQITQLIDKYEHETNKNQSEADLRAGYIDLLFLALGWNVYNDPQQSTNYRREGYIRGAGYVDVGLEVAGQPVLMLEAKSFGALPRSTERTYDRSPEEKQLFRYARGKRIPYCILTNFERLNVFNADHERLILAFDAPSSYLDRLSELLRLSPERVKGGSLPAWERQLEIKDIDEAFLTSLQDWRKLLANAIYKHNHTNPILETKGKFDFDKLMAAVQRILDRLILIRYADDKEVLKTYDVTEGMLSSYRKKGSYARPDDLMRELIDFSHRMDDHHNTTLFQPGHICEQVFVPNEVLEKVLTEINNISFRKFTSDILGNTYETYLGTKLAIKNGEIKSEERRDIRKAGGIFYTPPMIVRYIVDNTLGYLLKELEKEHGLRAIEKVKEIKVLDPACGSGSFLIYAYHVLAQFYRRANERIENERLKLLTSLSSADMFQRLELFKQLPEPLLDYPRHILEKQLYGVDIDPEAAEIAAVNLTMQAFAEARREKLPLILNENIKVGNSLISGTEEELRRYFGDNWQAKRPFNWKAEFTNIMDGGGFDVVLGNPPYIQSRNIVDDRERHYYWASYTTDTNHSDVFSFFVQRGIALLKQGGFLSYILPATWLQLPSFSSMRKLLLGVSEVKKIATFEAMRVFQHSEVESLVLVAQKTLQPALDNRCLHEKFVDRDGVRVESIGEISQALWQQLGIINLVSDPAINSLMTKLGSAPRELPDLVEVIGGLRTGDDAKYLRWEKLGEDDRRLLRGRNVFRYGYEWTGEYVWYRPDLMKSKQCAAPKEARFFEAPEKLLLRMIAGGQPIAAYDNQQFYLLQDNLLLPKSSRHSLKYVLGILNSRLMWFYLSNVVSNIAVTQSVIKQLPVRCIDFDNPTEKKIHDDLVTLVDKTLSLNKPLNDPAFAGHREAIQKEIDETERRIDEEVYKLYGLTKEEIATVEREHSRSPS